MLEFYCVDKSLNELITTDSISVGGFLVDTNLLELNLHLLTLHVA